MADFNHVEACPEAYKAGQDAAYACDHDPDHPDAVNPYRVATDEWCAWNMGWNHAPVRREG